MTGEGWDSDLLAAPVFFSIVKEINGKGAVAFGSESAGVRTLHISVLDTRSGRWLDHGVTLTGESAYRINAGSINNLRFERGAVYVDTHHNPSFATTALIDKDWKVEYVLDGWIVAMLRDGTAVYQKGEPHFAPVHPLELGVFDPETHAERLIYPRTPFGPVRAQVNAELEAAFDAIPEQWFMTNNHPNTTELVTEYLRVIHVVRERGGDTLVLNTVYDGLQFDPVNKRENRDRDIESIVFVRRVNDSRRTEYREFRPCMLRQQITFADVKELATPQMVRRVFALPYP